MMLILSPVSFQEKPNYSVPTNAVPLYTKLWSPASEALEAQLLAKVEITSQWSPLFNTGPEAFLPRSTTHFPYHNPGLPCAGVSRYCVLLPANVTPALPTAPEHLKQL